MADLGTDWRIVDGVATAWFDAPSLIAGAELAGRIAELSDDILVDLRASADARRSGWLAPRRVRGQVAVGRPRRQRARHRQSGMTSH